MSQVDTGHRVQPPTVHREPGPPMLVKRGCIPGQESTPVSPLNDAPYLPGSAHGGDSRSWKQKPQQGAGEATSELWKVRARLRNWP